MENQFTISQVLEQYTGFDAHDVLTSVLEKESSESRILNFLVSTGHITEDERSRCLAVLLKCKAVDEAEAEAGSEFAHSTTSVNPDRAQFRLLI